LRKCEQMPCTAQRGDHTTDKCFARGHASGSNDRESPRALVESNRLFVEQTPVNGAKGTPRDVREEPIQILRAGGTTSSSSPPACPSSARTHR
jgi:hypothetical protein